MGDCFYCEKEVEPCRGHPDPNVHSWCMAERDRRESSRECVFCATALGDVQDIKHESCRQAHTYHGYG